MRRVGAVAYASALRKQAFLATHAPTGALKRTAQEKIKHVAIQFCATAKQWLSKSYELHKYGAEELRVGRFPSWQTSKHLLRQLVRGLLIVRVT